MAVPVIELEQKLTELMTSTEKKLDDALRNEIKQLSCFPPYIYVNYKDYKLERLFVVPLISRYLSLGWKNVQESTSGLGISFYFETDFINKPIVEETLDNKRKITIS